MKLDPDTTSSGPSRSTLVRWFMQAVALGDALGASTEFLPTAAAIDFTLQHRQSGFPLVPVGGGWLSLHPGDHTDDTDMALALVQALQERNYTFDPLAVAGRFADWVESRPPDVGASIRSVVSRPLFRTNPYAVAREFYLRDPKRCANGALMRNGVIAVAAPDLTTAFEWSLKQGALTHYAPLSVLCCSIQIWLIFETFDERWPFADGVDWLKGWHGSWTRWVSRCADPVIQTWLDDVQQGGELDKAMDLICDHGLFDADAFNPFTETTLAAKQGWALLSLQIAVWAMQWSGRSAKDFPFPAQDVLPGIEDIFQNRGRNVIGWIPLIGHDSDTYGAIAGPMIAAACGEPFPARMTKLLAVNRIGWL